MICVWRKKLTECNKNICCKKIGYIEKLGNVCQMIKANDYFQLDLQIFLIFWYDYQLN